VERPQLRESEVVGDGLQAELGVAEQRTGPLATQLLDQLPKRQALFDEAPPQ